MKNKRSKYKVRNWSEYNKALKQRGSLEIWFDRNLIKEWAARIPKSERKKGAQPKYSDKAINVTLQFGKVFHQRLRQTEGLVTSLFNIMGLPLKVPDFSTLSRRGKTTSVKIPKSHKGKLTFIADSTGLKVYGEGEWKVKKHGCSKHRTWRKFHLAVTPDGEIRAVELTGNDVSDGQAVKDLLYQEDNPIETFVGDGGYDTRDVYNDCMDKGVKKFLIPPQKNAKIWKHKSKKEKSHPRDDNLRQIRKTTREKWKVKNGYHTRSLAETAMFRIKTIFGDKLNARDFERQVTEASIMASALNKITKLGMPISRPA